MKARGRSSSGFRHWISGLGEHLVNTRTGEKQGKPLATARVASPRLRRAISAWTLPPPRAARAVSRTDDRIDEGGTA